MLKKEFPLSWKVIVFGMVFKIPIFSSYFMEVEERGLGGEVKPKTVTFLTVSADAEVYAKAVFFLNFSYGCFYTVYTLPDHTQGRVCKT
tara:strand:- start:632 stop:898 length:267 start_codon:yes stop_codon:yes gene_type:complete